MRYSDKATTFRTLHVKGAPLVLWNIWDAGSAKAVAQAGAPAVATGSWSVAAAQGFEDGETLPMKDALRVAGQVAGAVDVPVTVDFEGGYAVDPVEVAVNAVLLRETGAVEALMQDSLARAKAYAAAGADGLFVPGLRDMDMIAQLCAAQDLPVNIMRLGEAPALDALAAVGVARVSHGPGPYVAAMKSLGAAAMI